MKDPHNFLVLSDNHRFPLVDINRLFYSLPNSVVAFWKDSKSVYRGCNHSFLAMTGRRSSQQIIGQKVNKLKPLHSECARECLDLDQFALDVQKVIDVKQTIYFENDLPPYEIKVKTFPIVDNNEKIKGIFYINVFCISLLEENLFKLINKKQIDKILILLRYPIVVGGKEIWLTRKETAFLLYLIKEEKVKKVAEEMDISKKTGEDYVDTLKKKFGCYSKSSVVSTALESDLIITLQKMILMPTSFNLEEHILQITEHVPC